MQLSSRQTARPHSYARSCPRGQSDRTSSVLPAERTSFAYGGTQYKGYGVGPFAEGRREIFTNKTLAQISAQYGKKPAQVILKWLREQGIIAIPKSVHAERIEENFAIDGFALSEKDKEKIAAMDEARPLILDISSLEEVIRLHEIRFEQ